MIYNDRELRGGGRMSLSEDMLKYRANNNLSLQKFSKLCNITVQTANNVENGKQKPSKLTEQKIKNVIYKED